MWRVALREMRVRMGTVKSVTPGMLRMSRTGASRPENVMPKMTSSVLDWAEATRVKAACKMTARVKCLGRIVMGTWRWTCAVARWSGARGGGHVGAGLPSRDDFQYSSAAAEDEMCWRCAT